MSFRINVLGTSNLLADDGQRIRSVLQQPRRFALLVYLALESWKGPVNRNSVLEMFWPEKPQDSAFGSLRQAVHVLRRSLGRNAVVTEGDGVMLDGGIVSCDAAELLAAYEAGRWVEAASLYLGEMLPGHNDDMHSPDFEQWLDRQRQELRKKATAAAWHAAQGERMAGRTADALVWARRAHEWSEGGEEETRRLMELMAAVGDRVGVLQAYEELSQSLAEFDARPSPETESLLSGMRDAWAEKDERCQMGTGTDEAVPQGVAPPPLPPPAGSRPAGGNRPWYREVDHRRARSFLMAITVVAVALVFAAQFRSSESVAAPRTVLMLKTLEVGPTEAPLAAALRVAVSERLRGTSALSVVFGDTGQEGTGLRGFVLGGSVLPAEQGLWVSVYLVDKDCNSVVASTRTHLALADSARGLEHAARAVASFVRHEIGAALAERRLSNAQVSPKAIAMTRLGRQDMALGAELWRQRSFGAAATAYRKSDSLLAEAIRLAPGWDLPWLDRAQLAHQRMWAARRPGGEGVQAARGYAAEGVRFASEALARSGPDADGLELRAKLHQWQWLLADSDVDGGSGEWLLAAERDARLATTLYPDRAGAWNLLGGILLYRGEWAEAYWALSRAVTLDVHLRNELEIVGRLFTAAWEMGNTGAARPWCGEAAARAFGTWPAANCEMHLMADAEEPVDLARLEVLRKKLEAQPGWPAMAHEFDGLSAVILARWGAGARAQELLARLPPPQASHEAEYFRAWALLELGDRPGARDALEGYVAGAPALRGARAESRRFGGLLERG